MPAPRPFIGNADLHLIGKLLDEYDDAALMDAGFSPLERVRADAIFDDINRYLGERLGLNWNELGVE